MKNLNLGVILSAKNVDLIKSRDLYHLNLSI